MKPFINLSLTDKPYHNAVMAAITQVLHNGQFIGGPVVDEFESQFARYIGVEHTVSCASGTDALFLAIKGLGIGPGDEVIVPSFTYIASASSVVNADATPVFCDVDARTFNIDVRSAATMLTSNTKAIMPVHMFGQCADMDAVMEFANEHNLFVIEDVAQACGATWQGKKAGSIGHVGCHSFFPTKNLGGYGDGGAITTADTSLAERITKLKFQGQSAKYHHDMIGYNSRLDTLQAAILQVKLPYIDEEIQQRQAQAQSYIEQYSDRDGITIPYQDPRGTHTFNQFTVLVHDRDAFVAELEKEGIPSMVYYPKPLHMQKCFEYLDNTSDLPVSECISTACISLPIV
jgi:dTDP-4-amino-4,6-dideoxygalactose transaminase